MDNLEDVFKYRESYERSDSHSFSFWSPTMDSYFPNSQTIVQLLTVLSTYGILTRKATSLR